MAQTKRHEVFVSYYHEDDQEWKDRFIQMMGDRIVDKSVNIGDIADNRPPTLVDTMSFQAPEYYIKLGYRQIGLSEGCEGGTGRRYFEKDL